MSNRTREWTVLSMMEWATEYFKKKDVPSPRLSIEWLLADLLETRRLDIYLMYDRPLSQHELNRLREWVKRRAEHEPLQYITGSTEFYHCTLSVNPSVLIPRQETEQLVDLLLKTETTEDSSPRQLIDIGTGSGCIPIAIKKARPGWTCYGLDISDKALATASENARLNRVDITWIREDLHSLDSELFPDNLPVDLITANLPYIHPSERESMERQVTDFEPGMALFHDNPAKLYDTVIRFAVEQLKPGGALYFECNPDWMDRLTSLKSANSFRSLEVKSDLDGRNRFLILRK